MVQSPPRRKLTVDDYYRMGESGIFGPEERVELLDGELYTMTPTGEGHIGGVISLNHFLNRRAGDQALVSVHNPIRLSDYSEPEPDIVLLRPRADFYSTSKARPEDVLLLIELADSSLDYDRLTKIPRYACAGIPEVWIANLRERLVEVYRVPAGDHYAVVTVHASGETLSLLVLPDVSIGVDEIFGQAR